MDYSAIADHFQVGCYSLGHLAGLNREHFSHLRWFKGRAHFPNSLKVFGGSEKS